MRATEHYIMNSFIGIPNKGVVYGSCDTEQRLIACLLLEYSS